MRIKDLIPGRIFKLTSTTPSYYYILISKRSVKNDWNCYYISENSKSAVDDSSMILRWIRYTTLRKSCSPVSSLDAALHCNTDLIKNIKAKLKEVKDDNK